jgi:hypothetical protein
MTSLSDEVKCTVHDGLFWMHLDDTGVNIPSHIVNESQLMMNILSSVADTSITTDLALAAPKEWLEAWASRYCSGEKRLRCANIRDLVSCLLVCLCYWNVAPCAMLIRLQFIMCCASSLRRAFLVVSSTPLISRVLCLQAADMLSIQSHLKDLCKVLAAKVLTARCNHFIERKSEDESSECCSTQVHLHAIVTCLRRCLVHSLRECTHQTSMLSASDTMPLGPQMTDATDPVTCNYKCNTTFTAPVSVRSQL